MESSQVFIFTGPTISPEMAQQYLTATYLPPVKLGDIYRIYELFQPKVIGIIDGYFNQVPAVWHKEIMHVMHRGVQVFGAASMGALRAAELDQLGMVGCGKIYEAYQSGVLDFDNTIAFEDDDEVAVIHSPAELGYFSASDAMVNIRFTLEKAEQQGVIDQNIRKQLINISKGLFYANRNYTNIIDIAKSQGLPEEDIVSLSEWLKGHAIDQKQLDAITLLKKINKKSFVVKDKLVASKNTSQWQAAMNEIDGSHYIENQVLNELRLKGKVFFEALDQVLESDQGLNMKASDERKINLTHYHRSPDKLTQALSELWNKREINIADELLSPMKVDQLLLRFLQQSGQLENLKIRSDAKKEKLRLLGRNIKANDLSEVDILQLCDWYFSSQLDMEIPFSIDKYSEELGLDDSESFYGMILNEYIYLKEES